jgi:hypothetical protein
LRKKTLELMLLYQQNKTSSGVDIDLRMHEEGNRLN